MKGMLNSSGLRKMKFKLIPMLNGFYATSEDGTQIYNLETGVIRKIDKDDSGYSRLSFCNKKLGLRKKTFRVADLVASAFHGEKPAGWQVDHIDRDKTNNHYTNLRYVPPSTNARNSKHRGRIAVALIKDNCTWEFPTLTAGAKFIEAETGKTRALPKMVAGRQYVYGFEVIYSDNRIAPRTKPKCIQLTLF